MNIKYVMYAVEINKCGSINKAAQNLYMSQSHLSECIKKLEEEIGYKIFQRTNIGVVPTAYGKEFFKSASPLLAEAEKIMNIPLLLSRHDDLSLCCTYSAFLMQSFINFINQDSYRTQNAMRETGLLDVARHVIEKSHRIAIFYCFRSYIAELWQYFDRYNLNPVLLKRDIPIYAVVSQKHPLAKMNSIYAEQLREHKLVVFGGSPPGYWSESLGFPQPYHPLIVFDRGGLYDTLLTGKYVTVMLGELSNELIRPDFVRIPFAGLDNKMDLFYLTESGYRLNTKEECFFEFLKERVALLMKQSV